MNQEILNFCIGKGILLDKETLNVFENFENPDVVKNLVELLNLRYNQKFISKSFFSPAIADDILSKYDENKRRNLEILFLRLEIKLAKSEIEKERERDELNRLNKLNELNGLNKLNELDKLSELNNGFVRVIRNYKNSPKKIVVEDFVKNFRSRYLALKLILQERSELDNLVSISRLNPGKQSSIIVLVYDKRITKNGNVMLEVEDLTGKIIALINKNRPEVYEKSKEILLDEVIALKCSGNEEMVFVNDIIFPDIKLIEKKKSGVDEIAAFISDVHVGSVKFLEKNFLKFIEWINGNVGNSAQRQEALKVRYLFVVGDTVDGVGVYPGQETQLKLKDVREQYARLAELLGKIRHDVSIILCPGQHDAVRIAEPQPIIGENYASALYNLKNLYLVTNPALIEIGSEKENKFKVLMYHGASMHGIVGSIEELRLNRGHDTPTKIVQYLLKKRHLAPTHSLIAYTPINDEDALVIKEVPDIVATGDLHRPEVSNYNGVLLIASSCWQSITQFEEKVGNNPDPCKVPIFNLKTRNVKILDFSEANDEEENKEGKDDEVN